MVVVAPTIVVVVVTIPAIVVAAVGMRHLCLGLQGVQLLELRRSWRTGTPAAGKRREAVLVHLEGQHLVSGRGGGGGGGGCLLGAAPAAAVVLQRVGLLEAGQTAATG